MNADHTLDVAAIRHVAVDCGIAAPWVVERVGSLAADRWYITGPDWPNGRTCHVTTVAGAAMGPTAEKIVAAVNAIPSLLDTLDAARAEVERLRIGLDGAHGNADRMRKSLLAERDAIAEKIAVAIEAEMRRHDGAQIGFSGKGDTYAHAARIAREVGKA